MAYDALHATLDALCNLHGHKVLSHVCLGALLREIVPEFDHVAFDRFRHIRNSINYYGRRINLIEGRAIITDILKLKLKATALTRSLLSDPSPDSSLANL